MVQKRRPPAARYIRTTRGGLRWEDVEERWTEDDSDETRTRRGRVTAIHHVREETTDSNCGSRTYA